VPREVIVLTMRTNQKYFACTNDEGLLAPAFICTANIDASDGGAAIVEGNRRVLAARLSDARFFWEQDLKVPLEQQAKKLEDVLFHEKLGFVSDKVQRVAKLARWLVESGVVRGDPDQAEQAARLAKADLVTGMVGEFPELQGVIGGYLAEAQGEPKAVVEAVRQHYRPAGQNDEIPTEPISVAVSLADKLDSLLWFFMSDEIPTGSKDPYALRRSALGAISLVIHNGLRLSLSSSWRAQAAHNLEVLGPRILAETELLASENPAYKARLEAVERLENDPRLALRMLSFVEIERFPELQKMVPAIGAILKDEPGRLDTLQIFFADRLKVQQREAGVRHDLIDAVFSLGGEDDLVRLLARVTALQDFVETGEGRDLLTAYKRAANILKKENFTGPEVLSSREEQGIPQTGEEDPLVLVEEPGMAEAIAEMASGAAGAELPEEHALIAALDGAEPKALAAVQAEDFTGAMAALATLRGPIDAFFDKVTVNDPVPEKRERRLNLLLRFRDAVNAVADFSKIEA
ncbi:glycine--tRNA ligase subunit beta, partial [Sphingomonas sp.]|uniref:glycine--tRNA ligase subunit beta n=1 Tax=Sphingomonas sp. TaxID=28214 RepID=UPI0025FAFCC7